jgi:DNA adenine methylase
LESSAPIIPWLGGKRRLADKLIPLFPPHECYVEAFCGGAALYFLRPVPAPVEVINDVNGELVNLYRVVQHHLEEFVRQFKWAISSRQVFKWQQMTRPETLTDIQRAARPVLLPAAPCFWWEGGRSDFRNGHNRSIGQPTVHRGTALDGPSSSGRNSRRKSALASVRGEVRPATHLHLPGSALLAEEGYGAPFEFAEYEAMAALMRAAKGKVMVSINDHPDIRRAFDGFHMLELDSLLGRQPARAAEYER